MTVYYRDTIGAIAVQGVEDVSIAGEDVYITAPSKKRHLHQTQSTGSCPSSGLTLMEFVAHKGLNTSLRLNQERFEHDFREVTGKYTHFPIRLL